MAAKAKTAQVEPSASLTKEDVSTSSSHSDSSVSPVRIASIQPNPHQPRRHFDEAAIKELADSIKKNGLIQPVIVRRVDGGTYELIAGERRFRAHKLLECETIPAIVKDVSEDEARSLAIIENLQREDLTVMEEAICLRDLVTQLGGSRQAAADKIGKSIIYVTDRVDLLDLPLQIQALLDEKKLNIAQAKVLLEIEGDETQVAAALLAVKLSLGANQLRGRIQHSLKAKKERSTKGEDRTTFNQVSAAIVRLYDTLNQFEYSMLQDSKKAEALLKQLGLLEKIFPEVKSKLEASRTAKSGG